jgi:DNA invertase Pin-like site-specific DNA recombinase
MSGPGQRFGYVRTISGSQNPSRQLEGQILDRIFEERASGITLDRPELENMLAYVHDGDEIVVQSMDRLARNLDHLRQLVQRMAAKGVKVTFVKEGMSFSGEDSPMATLMLSLLETLADFDRSRIIERQREGIELAKWRGVYKGRRPSLNEEQVRMIRWRVSAGEKKAQLAREYGVSRETLYSYLRLNSDGSLPSNPTTVMAPDIAAYWNRPRRRGGKGNPR